MHYSKLFVLFIGTYLVYRAQLIKLRSTHNEIIERIANTLVYFIVTGHTTLKRFNDIVIITTVIVFLAVIAMLSMISFTAFPCPFFV